MKRWRLHGPPDRAVMEEWGGEGAKAPAGEVCLRATVDEKPKRAMSSPTLPPPHALGLLKRAWGSGDRCYVLFDARRSSRRGSQA